MFLPLEQDAGSQFLQRVLRQKDEAFLVSFDVNVDLLQDFTDSPRELSHAMSKAEINTAGATVDSACREPAGVRYLPRAIRRGHFYMMRSTLQPTKS